MGAVSEDLHAVAGLPWQRKVADRKGDEQRDVPAKWKLVGDARLEVPMQTKQLLAIFIQDANFDGVLPIGLRPVQQQADDNTPLERGRQLAGYHGVETSAEDIGEPVSNLDGLGDHGPVQLHGSHSYKRRRIIARER